MGAIGSQDWTFIPRAKVSSLGSRFRLLLCFGGLLRSRWWATSHHPLGKGRGLPRLAGRFLVAWNPIIR